MMSRMIARADPFALLQQVDQRQRHLALRAGRCRSACPAGLGVAREVEQVVDELERDAEVEAVLAQRLLLLARHLAQHAADLRAPAEQIRRLAADDVEMLVFGDVGVAVLRELIQLAFDHPQRHVAQQPDDLERVVRERQRHRLDVQVVAEEHRDVVAPPRVHGQPAAPQIGVVDDVVVDERRGVDELDDRRVQDRAIALVARTAARPSAARPAGSACRRSSGCTGRSSGSDRPATGRGARTRDRPSPGRRESARRSARGRATISPQRLR